MISNISGTGSAQMSMRMQPLNQPMTDEQKTAASEILAKYDSANMTEADHESLRAEFEETGITPSQELGKIMEEEGFDAPQGLRGPQGADGEGKPEQLDFIAELIEKFESGEVSEDEIKSFLQTLQETNGETGGVIMDEYI